MKSHLQTIVIFMSVVFESFAGCSDSQSVNQEYTEDLPFVDGGFEDDSGVIDGACQWKDESMCIDDAGMYYNSCCIVPGPCGKDFNLDGILEGFCRSDHEGNHHCFYQCPGKEGPCSATESLPENDCAVPCESPCPNYLK